MMVFIGRCSPCQFGRHDQHYEVIQTVPPGMVGGSICGCKGECVEDHENPRAKVERDLAAIMVSYDEAPRRRPRFCACGRPIESPGDSMCVDCTAAYVRLGAGW